MSIDEFIAKIDNDREVIERAVESMSNEIAESSLTLLKDRSINEGIAINGDENNKASYSKNQISTGKFSKKVLNSGGRSYISANMLGTWEEFRKAQGLPGDPVNLSYTNAMWSHVQVLYTRKTGAGRAETVVGSNDAETNKKLSANEFLFGTFLTPTEDEVKLAEEVLQEKILKLLRQ